MFDFDSFREINSSIAKNKLRTILSGFSIAWGIFILIFLLGAGNGLKNGVTSNFQNRAKNSIIILGGTTSIPYKGLPVNREIKLDNRDFDFILNEFKNVQYASPHIRRNKIVSFNKEYGTWPIYGVYPSASFINNVELEKGRFINEVDLEKKRKVIVINTEMVDILFKGKDAIGQIIVLEEAPFQVIGVLTDDTGQSDVPAYIPFSTAQSLYSKGYGIDRIEFTVEGIDTKETSDEYMDYVRKQIGTLHNFDPDDKLALSVWNNTDRAIQAKSIFDTITLVIWVVGFATLLAGIVGIGNIMLITVKERTREFGIRKAIGATPGSVLRLVLMESVIITSVFGYIGMFLGIGVTELANYLIGSSVGSNGRNIFLNPTVNLGIALSATLILVIAGVFAGYIPAKKAVSIKPIEAMRAE